MSEEISIHSLSQNIFKSKFLFLAITVGPTGDKPIEEHVDEA